jgi:hypothetical protein
MGFGLCPLSGILQNTKEHNFLETGSVSILQWLGLAVSKGPNRLGVSHPLTSGQKQIRFLKCSVLYCSLEYRMMDRVLKPTNPDFHTPSLEPFRIYSSSIMIILMAAKMVQTNIMLLQLCFLPKNWS